jgi:hypothetical protein
MKPAVDFDCNPLFINQNETSVRMQMKRLPTKKTSVSKPMFLRVE